MNTKSEQQYQYINFRLINAVILIIFSSQYLMSLLMCSLFFFQCCHLLSDCCPRVLCFHLCSQCFHVLWFFLFPILVIGLLVPSHVLLIIVFPMQCLLVLCFPASVSGLNRHSVLVWSLCSMFPGISTLKVMLIVLLVSCVLLAPSKSWHL